MESVAYVHILTNRRHTVLYAGVTNDLKPRLGKHCSRADKRSFTARYNIDKLIYVEQFDSIGPAIARGKHIKGKSRKWKVDLINSTIRFGLTCLWDVG
jgi:putative endonuclease